MKYAKIFMLFLAAGLFAACSDDDDAVNSQQTTVGFASEELVVKENAGYVSVPIQIEGYRNGNIYVEVEAVPTGENPAIEDEHYMITDKTLTLLNDTTKTATLNVQFKTVDDQEINEARTFALNIKSLEGGQLTTKTINITLRDNDAAFYEKFFGKWKISFYDWNGFDKANYGVVEKTITITGPSDEDDPDYDKVLTVILGEIVSTYSTNYAWLFAGINGENFVFDDIFANWQLGEGDTFPTTIEWNPDNELFLVRNNGEVWGIWDHIKIEKVQ